MASAQDYDINFPYGATDPPYSQARFHRGDDRACPSGTPIVIEGQTIGLTGNTGLSTGPHLHLQEWNGSYANTRKPQNSFKSGTVINIDPNGTQGDRSFGKFITIQTEDGWNDSYCHLSRVDVQIGQVIGDGMKAPTDEQIEATINYLHYGYFGRPAPQNVADSWRGLLKDDYVEGEQTILADCDKNPDALKNKPAPGFKPINQTVYIKE